MHNPVPSSQTARGFYVDKLSFNARWLHWRGSARKAPLCKGSCQKSLIFD